MAQGNWATQQSATQLSATAFLEGAMFTRGYVPQYTAGTAGGINEGGLVYDAINALLNCLPQSIVQAWTPVSTATITVAEQTIAVTGSNGAAGDRVLVNYPGAPTAGLGMCMGARVSTPGANATVSVPFVNPTAGSLTAPSGNYVFTFIRS